MKYKFKPFSKNIIFYDSEFSTSNPYIGEVLSIGMVRLDGKEFYIEIEYEGYLSDWVKEKIFPDLKQKKITRAIAREKMKKFIGNSKPYMIAHFTSYDLLF